MWALNYIKQLTDKKLLDSDTAKLLTADVNNLGLKLGTLYSHSKQPMAFGYVQILLVLSGVYLPLLAFDLGQLVYLKAPQWIATLAGLISIMIVAMMVIGLRLLALRLQVPFEGVPGDQRTRTLKHTCSCNLSILLTLLLFIHRHNRAAKASAKLISL